jgi:hypothetical protein
MRPAGIEPTIPASERPQTYALDRAALTPSQLHKITHFGAKKVVKKLWLS